MSKADRLNRLDARRLELEADYTAALTAALKVTAAGKWGLFDHQGDRRTREAYAPLIAELDNLAADIAALRETLGLDPFDLPRDFAAARGKPDPAAVGEPKQAQAWLNRLAAADAAPR